jgi:hypothetical protein
VESERTLIRLGFAAALGLAMLAACGSGTGDDGGDLDGTGGEDGSDTGGASSTGGDTAAGGGTGTGGNAPGTGGLGGEGTGTGGEGTGGQGTIWPPAQRIALTAEGSCALNAENRVICWGGSSSGPWDYPEVFATNLSASRFAVTVTQLNGRGGYFSAPSDLEPVLEPMGGDKTFVKVGATLYEAAGLSATGELTLEIYNAPTAVVDGPTDPLVDVHGQHGTCGVRLSDGGLICWGTLSDDPCEAQPDHGQLNPPPGSYTQVSAGGPTFCALARDGSVACWGAGDGSTPICEGQNLHFGQTDTPDGQFVHVCAGYVHACAVRTDGSMECWGAGTVDGECGDEWDCGMAAPPPDDDFVQVACGQTHTCGLKENGKVVCWGSDTLGRSTPPPELQP